FSGGLCASTTYNKPEISGGGFSGKAPTAGTGRVQPATATLCAMLDTLITGGTLVDGTGAEARPADIGIADGRIVAVADPGELADATATDTAASATSPGSGASGTSSAWWTSAWPTTCAPCCGPPPPTTIPRAGGCGPRPGSIRR
ncbi:MAG: hypothetical protein F4Z23_10000, partial [Acidimicrobiaceae bacterium]|nr:hypothetical protein [Acidimicrobiaceae bacterium]